MPIYEYVCSKCSYLFEVLQSLNEKYLKVCCEYFLIQDIGLVKNKMSKPSVLFKGSGFYLTDYKNGTKKDNKT